MNVSDHTFHIPHRHIYYLGLLTSVVFCMLSAVCCLLTVVCCLLFDVCCLLSVVCCLLSLVCWSIVFVIIIEVSFIKLKIFLQMARTLIRKVPKYVQTGICPLGYMIRSFPTLTSTQFIAFSKIILSDIELNL